MLEVKLLGEDYTDIKINDDLVLHINRNSDGYSVDMYENINDNYENYNEYDCEDNFLAGTYVTFSEMKQYQED